jgi:hypothetical protein
MWLKSNLNKFQFFEATQACTVKPIIWYIAMILQGKKSEKVDFVAVFGPMLSKFTIF